MGIQHWCKSGTEERRKFGLFEIILLFCKVILLVFRCLVKELKHPVSQKTSIMKATTAKQWFVDQSSLSATWVRVFGLQIFLEVARIQFDWKLECVSLNKRWIHPWGFRMRGGVLQINWVSGRLICFARKRLCYFEIFSFDSLTFSLSIFSWFIIQCGHLHFASVSLVIQKSHTFLFRFFGCWTITRNLLLSIFRARSNNVFKLLQNCFLLFLSVLFLCSVLATFLNFFHHPKTCRSCFEWSQLLFIEITDFNQILVFASIVRFTTSFVVAFWFLKMWKK